MSQISLILMNVFYEVYVSCAKKTPQQQQQQQQ